VMEVKTETWSYLVQTEVICFDFLQNIGFQSVTNRKP
jgi:hypothetical protein